MQGLEKANCKFPMRAMRGAQNLVIIHNASLPRVLLPLSSFSKEGPSHVHEHRQTNASTPWKQQNLQTLLEQIALLGCFLQGSNLGPLANKPVIMHSREQARPWIINYYACSQHIARGLKRLRYTVK
jgi:hypothetical protein